MSYYAAGMVAQHLADLHPKTRATVRHLLITMATFVGESARDRQSPVCFASQGSLAARAGLSERAVRLALAAAEQDGLIARDGKRTVTGHATIRWGMPVLVACWDHDAIRRDHPARGADKHPARGADKGTRHEVPTSTRHEVPTSRPARGADKVLRSDDRKGGTDKNRRTRATAPASADAPAPATARKGKGIPKLGEVVEVDAQGRQWRVVG